MLFKSAKIFILNCLVLFIAGCGVDSPVQRIAGVGGLVMGQVVNPRHGEGELFTVSGTVPGKFDSMAAEAVPFEHRVYRIILERENVPGTADILDTVQSEVEKLFNITLDKSDSKVRRCLLPGSRIELRPAFHLGPRAVALDIIDLELEKRAVELKKSARYQVVRKMQKQREALAIIAQAVDGFRLDTGVLPENLSALHKNPGNTTGWNGPYLLHELDGVFHYRRVSVTQYELYAEVNGEKISEDSVL